jgi:hypothetical protein
MNRYNVAKILPATGDLKRRFSNIKYPSIPPSSFDIYVYVTLGDRYDTIALNYYSDSTMWWVISRANPLQPTDSLYPIIGSQIRIPSPERIPEIVSNFKNLNNYQI